MSDEQDLSQRLRHGLRRDINPRVCGAIPKIRVTDTASSSTGRIWPAPWRPVASMRCSWPTCWASTTCTAVRGMRRWPMPHRYRSTIRPWPVSAMAAVTETLGFGVTVSLTYEQPCALARRLSTLDHLTGGRVAWNIVTSYLDSAARNLGLDAQIPHDERYEIAEEYLEVCYKLWEASWEPGARRPRPGTRRVHRSGESPRHRTQGPLLRRPGPFLCEPSPQRTPMLFQAGASPRGVRFAAAHAEAVFVSGPTPEIVRQAGQGAACCCR